MSHPPRLAVLCDALEEGWPSMDLAADMLLGELETKHAHDVRVARVCPPFRRRASRLPLVGRARVALNADRLAHRFWDCPRGIGKRVAEFDLFHVVDHSYAHLVDVLPSARTGVFCHDLDTFRCLLEPDRDPRPGWFKAMARKILRGLEKAAIVFHSTVEVRRQIERHGLLDPARLVHVQNGIAPEYTPAGVDAGGDAPFVLHVGSSASRKRIDVLLDVFAGLRARHESLSLVQVGADWTAAQREQIARLGLGSAVTQLQGLGRDAMADLYRRSALLLLPSEAEGFGLPVIEALACGAVVITSDIPVLREVGGEAVVYCPVADVPAWVETVDRLLIRSAEAPDRGVRFAWAKRYSWAVHAETILAAYQRLG